MNYRREPRAAKAALFDGYNGLEEGLRTSSSYSHQTNEHDNDKAVDSLQDRVIFLKRLTGDIHEEVESHNRFLDQMGNSMDSSRGVMSGTMDRFKRVFEKKSNKQMCKLVSYFVVSFLAVYFLIRAAGNSKY
ncbi:bet1-like SNARE 1-2 isoform X2 [Rhodamnia argentea]|uniref:Bet1-like SNARE 1-2 isoform X2 n=1 Tax=Rhodamnia argentea TaxID=178133 RepID=A0ABM3H3Y5_9MYRT|nr:bet1-like SNARE 1-2 isoform X2 [Rhodamnia argentea]